MKLLLTERRIFYRFYEANLNRVVDDMNATGTVFTEKKPMIDTDMAWFGPSAVKAIGVLFSIKQLSENFLLQNHPTLISRLLTKAIFFKLHFTCVVCFLHTFHGLVLTFARLALDHYSSL